MNLDIFRGRRVLVTGHTGFKGSWLVCWLKELGAELCGYSLDVPSFPSHWEILDMDIRSEAGDIRDLGRLEAVFGDFRPELVFHLAAQPLVRTSYRDPIATWSSNVIGTLNVFEACRRAESVRAIINVTSDKCYENREFHRGYNEQDAMGGFDPYSASKGAAEILTASYRRSYFNCNDYGVKHRTLLASCRAGNVIGGGDWALERLVPDIMRATSQHKAVEIRNPKAVRPWQHVLEPLHGYLLLAQRLLEGKSDFASGWNFGPSEGATLSVSNVLEQMCKCWGQICARYEQSNENLHEAQILKLDCAKAHQDLAWAPVWDATTTFEKTIGWYRAYYETGTINTESDLKLYMKALKLRSDAS